MAVTSLILVQKRWTFKDIFSFFRHLFIGNYSVFLSHPFQLGEPRRIYKKWIAIFKHEHITNQNIADLGMYVRIYECKHACTRISSMWFFKRYIFQAIPFEFDQIWPWELLEGGSATERRKITLLSWGGFFLGLIVQKLRALRQLKYSSRTSNQKPEREQNSRRGVCCLCV